jgi:hypothetical protein
MKMRNPHAALRPTPAITLKMICHVSIELIYPKSTVSQEESITKHGGFYSRLN